MSVGWFVLIVLAIIAQGRCHTSSPTFRTNEVFNVCSLVADTHRSAFRVFVDGCQREIEFCIWQLMQKQRSISGRIQRSDQRETSKMMRPLANVFRLECVARIMLA
ncbi:hypothetical protein RBSH_04427 [Rhodopirellula baltica SH28]|uniref:Uncharacterized protein n=1 Tax=Rhodopirellula baltica SH28 TaxID=993517 RepID=K5D1B2_RHOBT|nr:hypothetical protein RBSH_04427 [Rhodopirellula baltica SH28]